MPAVGCAGLVAPAAPGAAACGLPQQSKPQSRSRAAWGRHVLRPGVGSARPKSLSLHRCIRGWRSCRQQWLGLLGNQKLPTLALLPHRRTPMCLPLAVPGVGVSRGSPQQCPHKPQPRLPSNSWKAPTSLWRVTRVYLASLLPCTPGTWPQAAPQAQHPSKRLAVLRGTPLETQAGGVAQAFGPHPWKVAGVFRRGTRCLLWQYPPCFPPRPSEEERIEAEWFSSLCF